MVLEYSEENTRRRRRISTRWNNEEDAVPISSFIKRGIKKSRRKRPTSLKSRSKTRKPKYLSLRLQFSGEKSHDSSEMPGDSTTTTTTNATSTSTAASHLNKTPKQQLNLFPLHPDDKEPHDENMPYLFSVADGGATTLTGLLGSSSATKPSPDRPARDDKNHDSSGATTLSPSGSLTYAYCGGPEEGNRDREEEVALVRTALRNKERERSEERWVRYSEVVERRDNQEVSSCAAAELRRKRKGGGLSLKLDYQEILSAWSDKGPLFIPNSYGGAAPPQSPPQTVPDIIEDDFLLPQQLIPATGMMSDGWGNYGGGYLWRVPEFNSAVSDGISNVARPGHSLVKVKAEEPQELGGEDQWKVGHREDSVRRYKEKRLNRLFSKRIRYQVRKLNAEKRPRLKGRFVKRS